MLSALTAMPSKAVTFAKEKVPWLQGSRAIVLPPQADGIRMNLWLKMSHEGLVRFYVGTPGKEPIASGIIQPSKYRGQVRDYGVLSVKGLRANTPITVTLRSPQKFSIYSRQEVFDYPYRVVNTEIDPLDIEPVRLRTEDPRMEKAWLEVYCLPRKLKRKNNC